MDYASVAAAASRGIGALTEPVRGRRKEGFRAPCDVELLSSRRLGR
jgi:hypothetical protein